MKLRSIVICMLTLLVLFVSCTTKEEAKILNVDAEQAYELLQTDKDLLILDVRTQKEYDEGHIEGALLIPHDELQNRLKEIGPHDQILVYCKAGKRSSEAVATLNQLDLDTIYHYSDGFITWKYEVVRSNGQ